MSDKLKLTLACGDYEIVRALRDGTVRPDGIDLTVLTAMGSRERHWRMARRLEFDICELNVGAHFMAYDQGVPLAGLPIYLHRRFRHGFLFVNAAAGIRAPRDLIGKTIGATNFQPAANIWMRGILEQYYGLPHRQVTWLVERSELAGRGFIAIALVIFSKWHPLRAIVGALLFGGAEALQLQLQARGAEISPLLLDMVPYVLTLLVLLAWGGARRLAAPASLGRTFYGSE